MLKRKNTSKNHSQKAFTLIELLVSATIIILLTTIGIVSFRQASISSRNSKRKADLESVRQALVIYKQDHGYFYPATSLDFDSMVAELQSNEYVSETNFSDPKSDGLYVYTATCERTENGNCTKVALTARLEPDAEEHVVSTF